MLVCKPHWNQHWNGGSICKIETMSESDAGAPSKSEVHLVEGRKELGGSVHTAFGRRWGEAGGVYLIIPRSRRSKLDGNDSVFSLVGQQIPAIGLWRLRLCWWCGDTSSTVHNRHMYFHSNSSIGIFTRSWHFTAVCVGRTCNVNVLAKAQALFIALCYYYLLTFYFH